MDKTIFEIFNGFGSKIKKRIIAAVLLIPMIALLLSTGYFYYQIQINKVALSQTIQDLQRSQAEILTATICETYKRSQLQSEMTKRQIVDELHMYYGDDVEAMKDDYENRDKSSMFYQIVSNNVRDKYINTDDDRNRMFIANRDGILIDNSLTYYGNSFMSWDEYFQSSKYSFFLEKAIKTMTLQNDKMILWVEDNSDMESISIFQQSEMMPIEEFVYILCEQNNLDELQNYSILSVSYIFDHKDIFGVPDVDSGEFTNNDKLFIIQVCSIRDILQSTHHLTTTLDYYNAMIEMKKEIGRTSIAYDTLVMIILVILELATFIGTWYLVEFYINNRTLILYQERNKND